MEIKNKLALIGNKAKNLAIKATIVGVAVNAMMINSFAESGISMDSVTDQLQTGLTDVGQKALVACGATIGIGLTFFGVKWLVKQVMGFFKRVTNN